MSSTADLVDAIDAFLALHRMAPATFGRRAMNDPHFVRDLKDGRRVFEETADRARRFMRQINGNPILCTACERRADAPENRACTFVGCPNAQRSAA